MLRSTLLVLPLALLGACASTPPAATSGVSDTHSLDTAQLGANHWRLTTATTAAGQSIAPLFVDPAKPVQLDFAEGILAIRASCNYLRGAYTLSGSSLSVGQMMSTMIGCPPELHAQDKAIGDRLDNPLTVRRLDSDALVLVADDGSVLTFKAVPTAETRYGGPAQQVFWEVAAQTKPCPHPLKSGAECLQVREIHYDANGLKQGKPGEFTHFYGQIEGFTHEPGVRHVLRLKRFDVANPPADADRYAYVLDMAVETELVDR